MGEGSALAASGAPLPVHTFAFPSPQEDVQTRHLHTPTPRFSRGMSPVCRGIKARRRKPRDSDRSGWRNWAHSSSALIGPPHRAPPTLLPSISFLNWKHVGLCPKPSVPHGGDRALGGEHELPVKQTLFPRTTAEIKTCSLPHIPQFTFWGKVIKVIPQACATPLSQLPVQNPCAWVISRT